MTASRRKSYRTTRPCFVTCTIVGRTPLFTRPDVVQRVLDSLRRLQEAGRMVIYGYVILEDHVHLLVSADDVAKEIGDFEASCSLGIMELLETQESRSILRQLKRHGARQETGGAYHLWEQRGDPQVMQDREMMRQELESIHTNPVQRGYVNDPLLWRYSSARNYAGQPGLLPVTTDW